MHDAFCASKYKNGLYEKLWGFTLSHLAQMAKFGELSRLLSRFVYSNPKKDRQVKSYEGSKQLLYLLNMGK